MAPKACIVPLLKVALTVALSADFTVVFALLTSLISGVPDVITHSLNLYPKSDVAVMLTELVRLAGFGVVGVTDP